jgi:hypothetical protein
VFCSSVRRLDSGGGGVAAPPKVVMGFLVGSTFPERSVSLFSRFSVHECYFFWFTLFLFMMGFAQI